MRGRHPLPNHVDLVDVHVWTFRSPILLKQRQGRRKVIGPADIFELVARFFGPFFGHGLVPRSDVTPFLRLAHKPNGDARAESGWTEKRGYEGKAKHSNDAYSEGRFHRGRIVSS